MEEIVETTLKPTKVFPTATEDTLFLIADFCERRPDIFLSARSLYGNHAAIILLRTSEEVIAEVTTIESLVEIFETQCMGPDLSRLYDDIHRLMAKQEMPLFLYGVEQASCLTGIAFAPQLTLGGNA